MIALEAHSPTNAMSLTRTLLLPLGVIVLAFLGWWMTAPTLEPVDSMERPSWSELGAPVRGGDGESPFVAAAEGPAPERTIRTETVGANAVHDDEALAEGTWSTEPPPGSVLAVRGRVHDVRGEPVEARIVAATRAHGLRLVSNAAGVFEAWLPEAGVVGLRVEADGHVPAVFGEIAFGRTDLDVLLDTTSVAEGVVRHGLEGRELAGVSVWLHRRQGPAGTPRVLGPVLTDEHGHYAFLDVVPGEYVARAEAETFASLELPSVSLRDVREVLPPIELVPGHRVDVRLVAVPPNVVSSWQGALLTASVPGPSGRTLYAIETTCGPEGTFELEGVPSGELRMRVDDAERGFAYDKRTIEGPATVALEVRRGGTLAGRVVDADGRAVAGAWVAALPTGRRAGLERIAERVAQGDDGCTCTDASGAFSVTGVHYGRADVVALTNDREIGRVAGIALRAVEPLVEDVVVRVEPLSALAVRVVDQDGLAVGGAAVAVEVLGTDLILPTSTTDPEGRVALSVPSSPCRLSVTALGYEPERRGLKARGATSEITVRLRSVFGITGIVRDPWGRSVPGASVLFQPERPPGVDEKTWKGSAERRAATHRARADALGRFLADALRPGAYLVLVQAWGYESVPRNDARVVVPGTESLEVVAQPKPVPRTSSIAGIVRDVLTLQALERFEVDGQGLRGGRVVRLEGGRFRWIGLLPGEGTLRVESPRFRTLAVENVYLHGGEELDLGVLYLEPGCDLDVRVIGVDGKPVAKGHRVLARRLPEEGAARGETLASVRGEREVVRLQGLPLERVEIVVLGPRGEVGRRIVTLDDRKASTRVKLMSRAAWREQLRAERRKADLEKKRAAKQKKQERRKTEKGKL